jgi:hypothetical protein
MRIFSIVAACALAWQARAAATDDAAIAALLDRMERAVLAGDAPAYLACIDTTEPEWAKEQENWAADLAEHTPLEFDLELTSAIEAREPGELVGDVTFSWKLPDQPNRRVSFRGTFASLEGEWRFAGEAWQRLESHDGQNIALYLGDDLRPIAERVIEVMPEIREHVDEGFETRLEHPQVIKLYDRMPHLQQSIYLSYTDPLGGWNEPGEAIKILADQRAGARQLRILLSHEYGHVATFTYSPDASKNIPWWVAEGVAELAAERFAGAAAGRGVEEVVRAWAEADALAAWGAMADFRQTPPDLHPHVYLQGHHFVGFVSEQLGRTRRNQWIRLLAQGSSLDAATREALSMGFDELDAQWRASLQPETGPSDDE